MLENEMYPVSNELEIIKGFDTEKWLDWIDDIFTFNAAYPFSQLSQEGDVIEELVLYLRDNLVPMRFYEEALVVSVEQNIGSYTNAKHLERLINALIILKGIKGKRTLLRFFQNTKIQGLQGTNGYIASKTLLALARMEALSEDDKDIVLTHVLLKGLDGMILDPAYAGNFLRFCYLQYNITTFFDHLITVVDRAEQFINSNGNEKLRLRYLNVLTDKFRELHYRLNGNFFSPLFNCILLNNGEFKKNHLYTLLVTELWNQINDPNLLGGFTNKNADDLTQIKFAKWCQIILNIQLNAQPNVSEQEIIELTAFLYQYNPSYQPLLLLLLQKHQNYVLENFRTAQYNAARILVPTGLNGEVIQKVIDLFDDALNTPESDNQTFFVNNIFEAIDNFTIGKTKPPSLLTQILEEKIRFIDALES